MNACLWFRKYFRQNMQHYVARESFDKDSSKTVPPDIQVHKKLYRQV